MKTKKILLLLVAYITTAMVAFSEPPKQQNPPLNTTSDNTEKSGTSILRLVKSGSAVKRSPSRNFLELYYERGVLTVLSSTREGEITISLKNNENLETIDIEGIIIGESVYIDLDFGFYNVLIEDCNNNTYSGELVIE
ncbi:MAG: hypothetical protein NC311_12630 [Muribaculaceae bacterium]|nr:hypothetical protein [Muribaculaceae bacterium]